MSLDVICFYGTEDIDDEFRGWSAGLSGRLRIDEMLTASPAEAASRFIDLSLSAAHKYGDDHERYLRNMSALLFKLAEREGFYEQLNAGIKALADDDVPSAANLLLYGLV